MTARNLYLLHFAHNKGNYSTVGMNINVAIGTTFFSKKIRYPEGKSNQTMVINFPTFYINASVGSTYSRLCFIVFFMIVIRQKSQTRIQQLQRQVYGAPFNYMTESREHTYLIKPTWSRKAMNQTRESSLSSL